MARLKVGIIGCGVIGSALAEAIEDRFSKSADLVAVCDLDEEKSRKLIDSLKTKPQILSIDKLIDISELIIEAAGKQVSGDIAYKALQHRKDIMVMSVGGLIERQDVLRMAEQGTSHLYVPSGAICGLDGVKAASIGKIKSATLTTRKPPRGLEGAPYIIDKRIDLKKIRSETLIFEGTASRAVTAFPKNINVCAALSLAGIGAQKTRVKIFTSPDYKANIHEIQVEGDFGKLVTRTENIPSPANPKTSFLAPLSAIATLKNILDVVKIGT